MRPRAPLWDFQRAESRFCSADTANKERISLSSVQEDEPDELESDQEAVFDNIPDSRHCHVFYGRVRILRLSKFLRLVEREFGLVNLASRRDIYDLDGSL